MFALRQNSRVMPILMPIRTRIPTDNEQRKSVRSDTGFRDK